MSGIKKSWIELLGSYVCLVCVLVSVTPGPAQTQDVDALIGQLGSSSAAQRARAACNLGRMRLDAIRLARDELLGLLNDGIEVDGRLCRDHARDWWDRGRFYGRFYVSSPGREAAMALEELGTQVLDPLIDRLQGQDPVGRENAAFALGLVESSQALEALSDAVRQDATALVRARAAWAIGMIEDPAAAEILVEAVEDEDPTVWGEAIRALGMLVRRNGFEGIDRGELADAVRRAIRRDL